MFLQVRKRDGRVVDFDYKKIKMAIAKANKSVDENDQLSLEEIDKITMSIYSNLGEKEANTYDVEEIQDIVENCLMDTGYHKVAKNYILYRNQRSKARNVNESLISYKNVVNNYIKVDDWRVKENATVSYSLGGLILSNSGAITANYWLSEIYPKDIADAHRNTDMHIHDLSMLSGYCAGWSLKQLIVEGLGGVPGKIKSKPAKHLSTLCNQMVNFLGIMQNEWAGAQAFSSFDTYLASFVKADNLSYEQAKQCIQSFVYGVNTPSRWGCQAPFTNITLDVVCPPDMVDMPAIIGGEPQDFTYGDCKEEMAMINKAFIEVMIEGDADGRGAQYPIPTYSITKDYDWSEDNEFNKMLFEMASKYGTPYFSNYVNSDMEPTDVRSMCPLTGDTDVIVRSSHGISIQTISDIYNNNLQKGTNYEVWTENGWCYGAPVRMPMTRVYKITLSNGCTVKMGENHLQPVVINGNSTTLQASELEVGMWIPFNTKPIDAELVYNEPLNDNTYRITSIEEIHTTDKYLYCFEVANDDHLFMLANGMITHNCRLRLDLRELRKKSGGFFGSGESTGSVGVVTINMPKIAYLSENKDEFYKRLTHVMDLAAKSIKIKRDVITQFMDNGLYPYTKKYLGTFANHFSTIGLVGMNEACLNAKWIRKDLTDLEAQDFTVEVLNFMRDRLLVYQEQYGDLYNLEATPAESTSYRFAQHDKEMFPDIITANENGEPYYTNSSHLPVGYTDDVFTALDIQDKMQTLYTSGTVFHTFLGERLPDWKVAMKLVQKIANNYKLPYYTLSPTYSICEDHGYIIGEHDICPRCGKSTEVYSRITGYYRAVQNWNNGKTQEFKDRKEYEIGTAPGFEQWPFKLYDKTNDTQTEETETVIKGDTDIKCNMVYLISTEHCPNCKIAKQILNNKGFSYTEVTPDDKNTKQFENVMSAPTLAVLRSSCTDKMSDPASYDYWYGVPQIKKLIESL